MSPKRACPLPPHHQTRLISFRFRFAAREFITRALLSARADLGDILDVLANDGVGTADGFNVNLAFLDVPAESRVFQTIEVTPLADDTRSDLSVTDFPVGRNSLHTNRSVRPKLAETNDRNLLGVFRFRFWLFR